MTKKETEAKAPKKSTTKKSVVKKTSAKKTENTQKSSHLLPAAIVAGSLIISGGLVYFGLQQKTKNPAHLDVAIERGIETYIAKQEAKMKAEQEKAMAAQKAAQAEKIKNLPPVRENEYVRGAKNADITIVEYSDFECPYCKRFSQTMNEVMKEFDGKVNRVFRHFPLPFHGQLAVEEAKATECVGSLAGAEKFWEYNDLIFETTKSNGGLEESQLPVLAAQLGVNTQKFNTCMKDEAIAAKVKADIDGGSQSGVQGTPGSFIINNKTKKVEFVNGALPATAMKAQINALLQ